MADEFDWHTDVDSEWEASDDKPPEPRRPISRRTRLVFLGLALCLLTSGAVFVYTTLNRRVENATAAAESGVLLAHRLLVDSALKGDADLFESLVARRPASWYALNRDLLARQLFFSRRPLGIEAQKELSGERDDAFEIRLSPEMDAAEVVDRRSYAVQPDSGMSASITRTVLLERTFFYERVNDQWLLTPPPDEQAFWGNWVKDERANLTLTYPERDEHVAIRLSGYLDELLPELCASPSMACPDEFHLEFQLSTDGTSIRRLGDGFFAIQVSTVAGDDRLVLPAPSLVGVPADEAGFEALKRGYAGWIAAAIVARYASPDPAIALDMVEGVLAEVGLQAPLEPVQPLPRPAMAAFPTGVPAPPDQDVLLLCGDSSATRLLRFQTSNGKWLEEATDTLWRQAGVRQSGPSAGSRTYLSRLPDYSAALIQTATDEGLGSTWRTFLLQDGSARLLTEETTTHYYLQPRLQPARQPSGPSLAFFVPGDDEEGTPFSSLLLDLDHCESSPCELEAVSGMPVWSPDGQRTLLIVSEPGEEMAIALGGARGLVVELVGRGQSPAWLDGNHLVYVTEEQTDQRDLIGRNFFGQVMLVSVTDQDGITQEPYFDAEMVRQAIPASIRPESLGLWTAQPALDGDTWWFVAAAGARDDRSYDYVLVYNRLSGEARLAADLDRFRLVEPPAVDPTGRYAATIGLSAGGDELSVELIDASTGEMTRLGDQVPADWSADGQWLIQVGTGGDVILVSTAGGQQWPIGRDLTGCYWAVWAAR